MNRLSRFAAVCLLGTCLAAADTPVTVDEGSEVIKVHELLERYAKANHLKLTVEAYVAELPLRFLEPCSLDRGQLSAVLRTHGVCLVSAGDRLYAGLVTKPNTWPAIPTLLGPEERAEFPTELITVVLEVDPGRVGRALSSLRNVDESRDVTLTWIDARLVITGPAERVGYYRKLAKRFESPPEHETATQAVGVKIVQLRFAAAEEVGHSLRSMIANAKGEVLAVRPRPTITASARTNQLLLRGPEPWLRVASQVVKALDVRVAPPTAAARQRVRFGVYALSGEAWRALSGDRSAAEIEAGLLAELGGTVERLWFSDRFALSQRDATLSQRAQLLGEKLALSEVSLNASLVEGGVRARLQFQLVEGGQALAAFQAEGVWTLDGGVSVQAYSLSGDRVAVFVTSGA